jgi:hypothetical protein
MQEKLFRINSVLMMALLALFPISALILLRQNIWQTHAVLVTVLFIAIGLSLLFLFNYYEQHIDRWIIQKMVKNGQVALAEIRKGTFHRLFTDGRFKKHVLWKLELDVYDHDHRKHRVTTIEKFSPHQTSIPAGSVYVTWDPARPDHIFLIPNLLIGSTAALKPLVQGYEDDQQLPVAYLNCFYDEGIRLMTYQQSMKEARKEQIARRDQAARKKKEAAASQPEKEKKK